MLLKKSVKFNALKLLSYFKYERGKSFPSSGLRLLDSVENSGGMET